VTRKQTPPVTTMSGPNRLAGRRDQASMPPRKYATIVQLQMLAITSGSPSSGPMPSFASAKSSDAAPATTPPTAMADSAGTPGARPRPLPRGRAGADALIGCSSRVRRGLCPDPDETSRTQPRSIACEKGGALGRGYSSDGGLAGGARLAASLQTPKG